MENFPRKFFFFRPGKVFGGLWQKSTNTHNLTAGEGEGDRGRSGGTGWGEAVGVGFHGKKVCNHLHLSEYTMHEI